MTFHPAIIVFISADAEWHAVRNYYPDCTINNTPYGEWFSLPCPSIPGLIDPLVLMHGGWGKVAAAASTQFAIEEWHPRLIINLGTCGGFEGEIERGDVILANKTVIYDIFEQMGNPDEHIKHYTTEIDISWIPQPYPIRVIPTLLVSGDRDLFIDDIPMLKEKYSAIAGDWESGAIAWVCHKNVIPCLILRGVTDLVGGKGGEAYNGKVSYYYENTQQVMKKLLDSLPEWVAKFIAYETSQDIKKEDAQ